MTINFLNEEKMYRIVFAQAKRSCMAAFDFGTRFYEHREVSKPE